jgi:RNA polymerase sigma-70 factor (ECF subfamily)
MSTHDRRRTGSAFRRGAAAAALLLASLAAGADVLQYGDGNADGKKSLGGRGHLILFDAGKEGRWLNKVEVFGARYGLPAPPNESFHLYLTDVKGQILRDVSLPYSLWKRGKEDWCALPIQPMELPKAFGIGLALNPTQTKGVFVGTDTAEKGYSYMWAPGANAEKLDGAAWMVRATVEDQKGEGPKPGEGIEVLQYGDGTADGKKSLGGNGHLILFDAGKADRWLTGVEVLGARYGMPQPPQEDFHLYVTDAQGQVLHDLALPYGTFARANPYWCQLPVAPVQVPKEFGIGLAFNPGATKGVYVSTDKTEVSHSYTWLPGKGMTKLDGSDWLVRPTVQDEEPKGGLTEVPGG